MSQLGSTSKSFTALAVIQLVEAGKIDLDAPITTYLPWFRTADKAASARITVRSLLNQDSGLPVYEGLEGLSENDQQPQATRFEHNRDTSTFHSNMLLLPDQQIGIKEIYRMKTNMDMNQPHGEDMVQGFRSPACRVRS
jgi:hypothetical protein